EAMQNRTIKTILQRFSPAGRGIAYVHIQSVVGLINSRRPNSWLHLPFNIKVRREYGSLIICRREKPRVEPGELRSLHNRSFHVPDTGIGQFYYDVKIPGTIEIPELGMTLAFDILDAPPDNIRLQGENVVYMDLEAMSFPLVIRNSMPGDRIQPLGMEGIKKLKCYFIDMKIPPRKRRIIPIMADAQGVLWIVGMRLSERVKITDRTKKVVKAEIV
ncbi:MAG: tRNA lysidine(34) synthetase TilS, partial [Syntrophales bacterium]|nr:tRNA lysidine(34) synthetase TilS [Syntrophales bacterium]